MILTKDNLTQLRDDYLRQALQEGAKTNFATGLLWGKVEMLNELLQELER